MSGSRQDFEDLIKKRQEGRVQRQQAELKQAAMAVPPMEALTGDKNWDLFLKLLEGEIQRLEGLLYVAKEQMAEGQEVSHEELIKQKLQIRGLRDSITALMNIRGIPKVLLEGGRKAARLLRENSIELQ